MENIETHWGVKAYGENADIWSKDAQNDIRISIRYEAMLFDNDDFDEEKDTLYSILENALDDFDTKIEDYDYAEDDKKDMRENLKYEVAMILNIYCRTKTTAGIGFNEEKYKNM